MLTKTTRLDRQRPKISQQEKRKIYKLTMAHKQDLNDPNHNSLTLKHQKISPTDNISYSQNKKIKLI